MRTLIAIIALLCSGCVAPHVEVKPDESLQSARKQYEAALLEQGQKTNGALASHTDLLTEIRDLLRKPEPLPEPVKEPEVEAAVKFEVPDFTPQEPSITESRVNELIEQFLSRHQTHAAATQRPVQVPAPQLSTFPQAPACVGGTCYTAPMTRQRLFRSRSR